MEVLPVTDESGTAQPRRFLLHFPTMTAADLMQPIGGGAANVLLYIGGYQVIRAIQGRMGMPVQWSPLKKALEDRLQIKQNRPLILELTDIPGLVSSTFPGHIDIVLSMKLGHTYPDGRYEANLYDISFPTSAASGDFPVRDMIHQGDECPYFRIEPALMPQEDPGNGH
jgi:hypothetical protein